MAHCTVPWDTPRSCLGTWHTIGEKPYKQQHAGREGTVQVHYLEGEKKVKRVLSMGHLDGFDWLYSGIRIPCRRALNDESLVKMSNKSCKQCPIEAGTSGKRVVIVKMPLVKTTTSLSACRNI